MESGSIVKNHIIKHKWQYILGVILLSISCILQLQIPVFLESFADSAEDGTLNNSLLLQLTISVVLVGLGIAFFRSISRIYIFRLSRILEKKVRRRLFSHWLKLPLQYYNKQRIGDLMSHAINDVNVIREVAMGGIFLSIEVVILITIAVTMMGTTINPWLTLVVILPLPGLTFLAYKFRFQIQKRSKNVQEAISHLTSTVQEFCSGIRVVKTYSQEKNEKKKFEAENNKNVKANQHLILTNSMFISASMAIVGLSYLLSIFFGGLLVMNGTISLGEFVAFNTYLSLLIQPVENLGKVINILQRGWASNHRLRTIFNIQSEVQDNKDEVLEDIEVQGDIQIENLSFSYPDSEETTLRNIDLTVPKGSSLAIVGRVGSGKTTLINLLLRTYNPPRGSIFIDGNDIFQIPLQTLRKSVGIVPQENFLFSSDIKKNIAFNPGYYGDEDVTEAAKLAQVYDNIIDFPQEFRTPLGERGISLSGGQRQRISIARSLLKNAPILIFDDSLSAVDAQTEEKILKGLKQKMDGRTTIIVSHRISSIKHADQIIVMNDGEIVERGTHATLIKQKGIYRRMYEKQTFGHNRIVGNQRKEISIKRM
ncbi:ABC transporter ATP-binding protein [Evansella sp. AB-P1]|uniref:ABC transporter ATP-binding protein n=1 Tax=Evansella sp. AB-P1 TaxID=3037653 RepID=UPI00241E3978|nr:ABC transporter ATP-binding protein [Evansella sp. AB-P1]MDG5789544.1 ABC transporter ATP-binding protein [Evansella sp. AB-P1]